MTIQCCKGGILKTEIIEGWKIGMMEREDLDRHI